MIVFPPPTSRFLYSYILTDSLPLPPSQVNSPTNAIPIFILIPYTRPHGFFMDIKTLLFGYFLFFWCLAIFFMGSCLASESNFKQSNDGVQ
jgi:hypothetical protein